MPSGYFQEGTSEKNGRGPVSLNCLMEKIPMIQEVERKVHTMKTFGKQKIYLITSAKEVFSGKMKENAKSVNLNI